MLLPGPRLVAQWQSLVCHCSGDQQRAVEDQGVAQRGGGRLSFVRKRDLVEAIYF